jgi:hypothetical protein
MAPQPATFFSRLLPSFFFLVCSLLVVSFFFPFLLGPAATDHLYWNYVVSSFLMHRQSTCHFSSKKRQEQFAATASAIKTAKNIAFDMNE